MFTKRTLTGTVVAAGLSLATLQAAQAGVVDFTFTGEVGSWSYDSTSAQFTPVPISGVLTLDLADAAAGEKVAWNVSNIVSLKLNGYLAQENNPPYTPTNAYNEFMPAFYRSDVNIATTAGGGGSVLVQPLVAGVVWEDASYWELDSGTFGSATSLGAGAYGANPFANADNGYLQINASILRSDAPLGSYTYDQYYELYLQLESGVLTESLFGGNTNKVGGSDYSFDGSHTSDIQWQASPVPVPAALPLFLSALGLLGALRRSRAG